MYDTRGLQHFLGHIFTRVISDLIDVLRSAPLDINLDAIWGWQEFGPEFRDIVEALMTKVARDETRWQHTHDVLQELSARQKSVIELRYDLDDGEAKTLEEVAAQIGVSSERIRQILGKTLVILTHPSSSQHLVPEA